MLIIANRSGVTPSLQRISSAQMFLCLVLALVWVLHFAPAADAGILGLAWDAPTTNSDGTTLTDLSGYNVYAATSSLISCPPGTTPQFVASSTPSPTPGTQVTHQLTGLIADGVTPYFVQVTAVDFGGNESTCSNEASGLAIADPLDTTLPIVSLTAPSNGAAVAGTVTVSATASDNVGVVGVQFRLDGAPLGTEDTSAPYSRSWNTTTASGGSHTLTAVARDAAGNTATSSSVIVTADNSPPTVTITAPTSGATLSGTVTVSAAASDNVGVAGVQFRLDGAPLGAEDTTSPYSVSWNTATASNGSHLIIAVARDTAGNTTTDNGVPVTVSNSSPGPGPAPSASGGGGAGCFIATAAFGSPLAQEVGILREFRDRALLTHAPGRVLVAAYYQASPPLAELIRQHEALRTATRVLLWPVVWWAYLALVSPGLAIALGGIGLALGPLLVVWLRRTRRAPRQEATAMSRPSRSGSLRRRTCAVLVCAGLVLAGLAAAEPPASKPTPGQESLGSRGEIGLPAPVRYAIFRQAPGEVRRLLARGDVLFHPQDPTRSWTVERVEGAIVLFREGPRGPAQALAIGQSLPGFPGLTLTGTVVLDQLHYRYRVVDRVRHPDPVLVALEGSRAILEVETLHSPTPEGGVPVETAASPTQEHVPPARATLSGDLLEKIRVKETRPGLYDVPATDVQAVLDNAGRVLADLEPFVLPSLSFETGLQYRITSAASDGILSKQGFTVTAPKLAERAGIEVGDTILRVNGRPVDGFASLYGIFQAVRQDPALRTVQVELDRRGTRLTKTYRIR